MCPWKAETAEFGVTFSSCVLFPNPCKQRQIICPQETCFPFSSATFADLQIHEIFMERRIKKQDARYWSRQENQKTVRSQILNLKHGKNHKLTRKRIARVVTESTQTYCIQFLPTHVVCVDVVFFCKSEIEDH